MDTNPYDCRKCGACCGFFCTKPDKGRSTVNTPLTERDIERMPLRLRKRLVQIEAYDRMTLGGEGGLKTEMRLAAVSSSKGNVCEHFKGYIGEAGCGCAIYKYRPFNCRYFANDKDHKACRMARSAYGLELKEKWLNSWDLGAANEEQRKNLEPYVLPDPMKGRLAKYAKSERPEGSAEGDFSLSGCQVGIKG